jgi:thymidylate synthase (FAD)
MAIAETSYLDLLAGGASPQQARAVLPNSLKTEIVCTYNLRQWRHFFRLRTVGTSGKPHPQMLEITVPMLERFKQLLPVVFDDLVVPQ